MQDVGDMPDLAAQQIGQAFIGRRHEHVAHRRTDDVGVDQKHLQTAFRRQAQRQIDGGEGLAFAGQRAGHHDQIADRGAGLRVADLLQQPALDAAEFVGDRRCHIVRRDQPVLAQGAEVQTDRFAGRGRHAGAWAWARRRARQRRDCGHGRSRRGPMAETPSRRRGGLGWFASDRLDRRDVMSAVSRSMARPITLRWPAEAGSQPPSPGAGPSARSNSTGVAGLSVIEFPAR